MICSELGAWLWCGQAELSRVVDLRFPGWHWARNTVRGAAHLALYGVKDPNMVGMSQRLLQKINTGFGGCDAVLHCPAPRTSAYTIYEPPALVMKEGMK
jgi:hypothetical protein